MSSFCFWLVSTLVRHPGPSFREYVEESKERPEPKPLGLVQPHAGRAIASRSHLARPSHPEHCPMFTTRPQS
jgi:hypothetical protein